MKIRRALSNFGPPEMSVPERGPDVPHILRKLALLRAKHCSTGFVIGINRRPSSLLSKAYRFQLDCQPQVYRLALRLSKERGS